jgi:hypothetical protein
MVVMENYFRSWFNPAQLILEDLGLNQINSFFPFEDFTNINNRTISGLLKDRKVKFHVATTSYHFGILYVFSTTKLYSSAGSRVARRLARDCYSLHYLGLLSVEDIAKREPISGFRDLLPTKTKNMGCLEEVIARYRELNRTIGSI